MIIENLDYRMHGTWYGKPMLPICNRKERRKYIKEHKHDKDATNCMYCNAKTMTITDDNGKCVCELVNEKRDRDEAITECKNAGWTPYVRNYSDSRYRPIVNCIFDKEEKE
jgi:hypothetical protein